MANNKLAKIFITAGAIVAMLPLLAGCTSYKMDRAEQLNTNVTHVLSQQIEMNEDYGLVDYQFIGADVAKTAFDFGVKFNGVSSLTTGEVAFTSLDYVIPSEEFIELEKSSTTKEVYNVLDEVVANYEPVGYSVTPVTSLTEINDVFVKNAPTPFKGYNLQDAMVYNLGKPKFDQENLQVTFDVKTLMELSKIKRQSGWGLCLGFDGTVCFGYGIPITYSRAQGTFTTIDRYTITVDQQTFDAMQKDQKLVYEYCATAIKAGDENNIKAERQITSMVTYDEADMLKQLDMPTIEDDLCR